MNLENIFRTGLFLALACNAFGANAKEKESRSQTAADAESAPASVSDKERSDLLYLNQGYAQLAQALSSLRWTDKILLVKFESERLRAVGKDISKAASQLLDRLNELADSHSGVSLEDDGLPAVSKDNQSAVQMDRLKSFAPIVGRSGANFERTLLLSNSGGLNHTRHLCGVLLKHEERREMQSFLQEAEHELNRLYARVVVMLNEDYFKHNTYTPPEEFGEYVTRPKSDEEKKAGSAIDN